ncbi:MAG: alpha-N-arabinofuranosidase [Bacillota bacterium]
MGKKAKVTINPDYKISKVEDRIFGAFLEPIRSWVYGGIYNPRHPEADELGFRQDIIRAVREFGVPAVRLPGGNFVSGWDWRDSIGPVEKRKAHLDLAWRQYEPNLVGHDEYIEWTKRAGVEPLYTINLGTGDINSAIECIEYSNHPGGTYWSDLRKKNGHPEPYGIKIWYLGNEADGPWQIRSWERDPKGYGVLAHETSKAMKWVDPSIETVACVSSSPYSRRYPQWDVEVLEQCYETVDYISLHHYHGAPVGNLEAFLNASSEYEKYINTEIAVCDYIKAKLRTDKTMMLSFDEYAVMFREQGDTFVGRAGNIPFSHFTDGSKNRPFLYFDPNSSEPDSFMQRIQQSQVLNALVTASIIMTFIRHADRVKIACMTGGIHGAIAFDNRHVWKSAAYYVYHLLYKYGRGMSILPAVDSPRFDVPGYDINGFMQCPPYEGVQSVEAAAVMDEEKGEASIFLLNRDINDDIQVTLDVRGFEGYKLAEHIEFYSEDLNAGNTYENPDNVKPVVNAETKMDSGKITFSAKKLSWNIIRLKRDKMYF